MPKKRKEKATEGFAFMFHGSFGTRENAKKKAKKRKGFVISRKVPGMKGLRYIVMTQRAPF